MACRCGSMSVTAEMLKGFLEGWTLKQIIEAKRLYYVDLKIAEDLPTKDENEVIDVQLLQATVTGRVCHSTYSNCV